MTKKKQKEPHRLIIEEVYAAVELYKAGYNFVELGKMFNVEPSTFSHIFRGKSWKHLKIKFPPIRGGSFFTGKGGKRKDSQNIINKQFIEDISEETKNALRNDYWVKGLSLVKLSQTYRITYTLTRKIVLDKVSCSDHPNQHPLSKPKINCHKCWSLYTKGLNKDFERTCQNLYNTV